MFTILKNVTINCIKNKNNIFVNTTCKLNETKKCFVSINSINYYIANQNKVNSQNQPEEKPSKSPQKSISQQNVQNTQRSDYIKNYKKKSKKFRSLLINQPLIPSFKVKAYATADWYDLNGLKDSLIKSSVYDLFEIGKIIPENCICVKAKYEEINEIEPRHIFFYEDGSLVLWNVSNEEEKNILEILSRHEENPYSKDIVNDEIEVIPFSRIATLFDNSSSDNNKDDQINEQKMQFSTNSDNLTTKLYKNHIYFNNSLDMKTKTIDEKKHILEKYAFSDAISLSVKLAIWERHLDEFSERIEFISNDLKGGNDLKLKSGQVLRLLGELFSMRHAVNLHSNFLDTTPDFYWDRPTLEHMYHQMHSYLSISKRTRLFNERLNHCIDLIQILEQHLKDNKHTRLEWIIIALIALEFLTGLGIFDFIKSYLKTVMSEI